MKELTKEFRNRIYTIMLSMILETIADRKNDDDHVKSRCRGFCAYLNCATNNTDIEGIDEYVKVGTDIDNDHSDQWKHIDNPSLYPELLKHKPDNDNAYWFEQDDKGAAKRVSILEEAIRDTETNLPMCPACGTHDISADEDGHFTCNKCE